jgi:hypothetical protein
MAIWNSRENHVFQHCNGEHIHAYFILSNTKGNEKKKQVDVELEHSEGDFNNQCCRIYEFFYNLLHKPRILYNLGLLNLRSRTKMRINEISFN